MDCLLTSAALISSISGVMSTDRSGVSLTGNTLVPIMQTQEAEGGGQSHAQAPNLHIESTQLCWLHHSCWIITGISIVHVVRCLKVLLMMIMVVA